MKKYLSHFVLLLFACCGPFLSSQAAVEKSDSLQQVLKKATGTSRVDVLNELFGETYKKEPEQANKWLEEAIQLCNQLNYTKGKIVIELNQARQLNNNREFEAAITLANKVLVKVQKENMPKEQSMLYRLLGSAYRDNSQYAKATQVADEYLNFAKKQGNNEYMGQAYSDIGLNGYYTGNMNVAMENFKLSMACYEKNGDFAQVSGMAMNIGVILYRTGQAKESLKYYDKSLKSFEKLKDTLGIANTLVNQAMSHEELGTSVDARKLFLRAADLYKKIKNEQGYNNTLENLSIIYSQAGDYSTALKYNLRVLENREKLKDKRGIAGSYINIGSLHEAMRDTLKGIEYVKKAIAINKEIGNEYGYSTNLMVLGNMHRGLGSKYYAEAIQNFRESVAIKKRIGDHKGLSGPYIGMGNIYYSKKMADSALFYYLEALKINEASQDAASIAGINANIGTVYKDKGNYSKAIPYLLKARIMQRQINDKYNLSSTHLALAQSYAGTGQYKQAYEYYTQYHAAIDSMFNENMSKSMAEMQTKYEVDKKQKENEILQQRSQLDKTRLERNEEARKKQSIIIYAILGVVALIVVLLVVVLRSNVQRKKTNQQLTEQNTQIRLQKNIIEEKNRDITDSISYAKRIQEAILPPDKVISQYLNESFVLYKPKDIVSGDFYWMEPVGNKILFAVVDCTGHGVPGAFVSIVGHNNLNRTVKEYGLSQPAKILDKLNELVEETFDAHGSDLKDGMDISLCALNTAQNVLEWAGANNPLWIIKNNGSFTELKPDKQPIGKYIDRKPFTGHSIQLEKGDTIYIFSDGYADQFGGPSGKKFKYSQLKDILISINKLSMGEQRDFVRQKLEDWRGELEQIDDICMIGLRV